MTKNNTFDRDQLVLDNLGLVEAVVNRLTANNAGAAIREDLVQEGNLALVEAANRYVPGPAAFSTYAWTYVMGAVKRALRNETMAHAGRVPEKLFYDFCKVGATQKSLEAEGKDFSPKAVAKAMGKDLADVVEALAYCDAARVTVGLGADNSRDDDEDFNLPPVAAALSVPSAESDFFAEDGGDILDQFDCLDDKEKQALRVRCGFGRFADLVKDSGYAAFSDVAVQLGMSTKGAWDAVDRARSKCIAAYGSVPDMAA